MRLAIVSDLHADLGALDEALARVRELGCDLVVCAGDLVDGDVFPDEVIARLASEKIPTICGNHDRWAIERARGEEPPALFGSGFELAPESLRFLGRLPTSWSAELEGVRVAMWHASPGSDMEGIYPETTAPSALARQLNRAGADVLLVGHTHEAFAVRAGASGLIANPGALYRRAMTARREGVLYVPGADMGGGTFGVLELPARVFRVYGLDGELLVEAGA